MGGADVLSVRPSPEHYPILLFLLHGYTWVLAINDTANDIVLTL